MTCYCSSHLHPDSAEYPLTCQHPPTRLSPTPDRPTLKQFSTTFETTHIRLRTDTVPRFERPFHVQLNKQIQKMTQNQNTTTNDGAATTLPAQAPAADSIAAPTADTPPAAAQQAKPRPLRRANTTECHATHNAVERARRETLNGRFETLASLLPPLSALRRPSKAAIVAGSIATLSSGA
ncbi:hypothetical protein C8J57DRAFT_1605864 [Mycena rebaudengoi]|nr:hypothetical protein C8J57DRAFT_1605864 [Mycena rebaudengoi]